MNTNYRRVTFGQRLASMLKVDFRRMFTMRLVYIMVGACLVAPILILVMTTMMDGSVSVNPQTGAETVIEGFDSAWQIIGTVSGASSAMSMDMTGMCNINLLYFAIAAFVCLFVADDFRSGYAKNLFTVRARKGDYVISKTLACFACGVLMVLAFFAGSMLGGKIAGLPLDLMGASAANAVMCLACKALLMAVFVPIYLVMSAIAKQKVWLSLCCSFAVSMLLFMMIPMLAPLDATMLNVVLCFAGGTLFSVGLGFVSRRVLNKTSLV